jgi:hypothetical protein
MNMNMKRTLYAVAVLVMGGSGPAAAVTATAKGPLCNTNARVISTTYSTCSGSSHTALDISNVACGEPLYAPLSGSYAYRFYGGCPTTCYGHSTCSNGQPNYYVVTGSDGWDFRMLHLTSNADTGSKTCDGCRLGLLGGANPSEQGVLVHLDNRQYGTRKSSWYTLKGVTCGSSAYCGNVIGTPTL